MISPRIKAFLAIVLAFTSTAFTQQVDVDRFSRFANYTVQDGLSHNTVNDIIQDKNGFMWFATENGLSRYDGYSFVNFFHNPENPNSIPGNSVLTLAIDSQDFLWIGTTDGLCRLSLDHGNIQHFQATIGDPNSPRTNHIRKLYFSAKSNTLWIETLGGVLSSFDIKTEKWKHFSHIASAQPYYRYHTIFEDSHGDIWVGGRNTPIIKLNKRNETIHNIYSGDINAGGKRENDLADIYETSKGKWYVMGLDGIYEFFPYTEKFNRIHSSSSYSVVEDTAGALWFGSGFGLLKYDDAKNQFVAYRNNKNNPKSIVHNHINKVYIDKAGNIWAGTREGVSLLSQRSKNFSYYFHIPGDDKSLSDNNVTAIAQDTDGTLYVGTAHHGLSILEPGHSEFKQIQGKRGSDNWLSSERISSLYFDSEGILWIGLWSGVGFNSYNPKTKTFKRYALEQNTLRSDWYNAFLEDSEGHFIAGLWGARGAMYFDRDKGMFTGEHYITYNKPYNLPIEKIMHDGTGNYFMLSRPTTGYLYHYSDDNSRYKSYAFSPHPERGDVSNRVTKTNLPFSYTTLNGMANNGRGLSVFSTNSGLFTWDQGNGFQSFYEKNIEPIDVKISSQNRVLLLEHEQLSIFDSSGSVVFTSQLPPGRIKQLELISSDTLVLIGEKELYIGTIDYQKPLDSYQRILFDEFGLINHIEVVKGDLWLSTSSGLLRVKLNEIKVSDSGCWEGDLALSVPVTSTLTMNDKQLVVFSPLGIYKYNPTTGTCSPIQFSNVPEGFRTSIQSATLYNNSTIWVVGEVGHYQVNINTGEIINTNLPDSDRLSSHLTSSLMEDANGDIWVGTTNMGLNRISRSTGIIKHFYEPEIPSNYVNTTLEATDGKIWVATRNGLCYIVDDFVINISNIPSGLDIRSLVEDHKGNVWAGTNNGLLVVNPSTFSFDVYNVFNGFPSTNFSKACVKLNDNRFAFGTSEGVVVFNPNQISTVNNTSTDVAFTHFDLFGIPQNLFMVSNDTIQLTHTQNFFTINFSAADFGFGDGTTYFYKLQGVDPTWTLTQSSSVSYTNVRPGRYLFQVAQLMANGKISDKSSTLIIRIKPALWQTLGFKLAIVLLVLGGIGAYAFTYIRQLKAARLNVELEQRLLISQMNPHFIFNSLSAIQSFMYRNQPEEAGNYLSSFSQLVRLILENSRSAFISLGQEVRTLELYLTLQKLRFPNKIDYAIEVDPNLLGADLWLPPMLAQPFIENSIEHGIMHKDGSGNIQVRFMAEGSNIMIVVEDDGVGLIKSKEINKSKRMSHTSYATSITRDRIKGFAGKYGKSAGVNIIDLSDHGSQGTRVEITIPTVDHKISKNNNRFSND